jgi:Skp family chaperone for outer membrane proteins
MRGLLLAAGIAALIGAGAQAALAQQSPQPAPSAAPAFQSPVLTLKQDALFENSAFGKAALAQLEAATQALKAENREIEAGLEEEERNLTVRRQTLPPAEFKTLSAAFDTKVEGIRTAQDSKSRNLNLQLDEARQRLFEQAVPIIADLMRENGAVALLDQSAVVLSLDRIDITDQVIQRLDANLKPDTAPKDDASGGNP